MNNLSNKILFITYRKNVINLTKILVISKNNYCLNKKKTSQEKT